MHPKVEYSGLSNKVVIVVPVLGKHMTIGYPEVTND